MKRLLFPAVLLAAAFSMTGCLDDVVSVNIRDAYDLQVQAWDNRINGAFQGALITVIETGDASHTGSDGWTDYLQTPANAQVVRLVVQWYDRHGYTHSYETEAWLQHQTVTRTRVNVDSTPYH